MSDKKHRNGGNVTLNENGETVTDVSRVCEIFNDFFVDIAIDIGFNDDVISASDAIIGLISIPVLNVSGSIILTRSRTSIFMLLILRL